EIRAGEGVAQRLEFGGRRALERFEGGSDAEPSGEVEACLGPGENPGDGPEIGDGVPLFAGPAGGPGADAGVLQRVDRGDLAVEIDETVGLEQLLVGLLAL